MPVDAFVFASRTETQGLVVLLEAMALGLPVVSTAVMGTRDILEPGRGVLVAPEGRSGVCRLRGEVRSSAPGGLARRLSSEARGYASQGPRHARQRGCWNSMQVSLDRPARPVPVSRTGFGKSRNALTPFCDYPSLHAG